MLQHFNVLGLKSETIFLEILFMVFVLKSTVILYSFNASDNLPNFEIPTFLNYGETGRNMSIKVDHRKRSR